MRRVLLNWKFLGALIVIAAVLAMALWPETLEVDVERVSRGTILVTIDEEGETRVRESFVVAAPVSGRLQRIELEPGDPVEQGHPVAQLIPGEPTLLDTRTVAELTAAVEAARTAVDQAEVSRAQAATELERATSHLRRREELAEAGIIPRDELEADQTAYKVAADQLRAAELAVARAQQELQAARARLDRPARGGARISIPAPASGVVLERFRESEADVAAGEPLLEIGDPRDLEIVSDLLSTDAVRITPGNRVLVEDWGGDHPLAGRVRRIEPSGFMKVSALGVEEQRVNVIIDFEDEAAAAAPLGDGYRVEVRVVVAEAHGVLKVPVGSLFRRGDQWAAFTIVDGIARIREVEIGQRNELEGLEIRSGLAEGDPVILHPPDVLTDGMRVRDRQQ